MRYRLATAADVPTCQRLIGHGFSASRRVNARLLQIWRDLIISNPGSLTVIEDPERPHPDGIESFAARVFVSDAFIAEFLAAPQPYLSAIIYERVLRGDLPILSLSAVRDGNSGPGLNLVCLHFCSRDPDLNHPRTRQILQVSDVAFFFFSAGYRINSLYQEVPAYAISRNCVRRIMATLCNRNGIRSHAPSRSGRADPTRRRVPAAATAQLAMTSSSPARRAKHRSFSRHARR